MTTATVTKERTSHILAAIMKQMEEKPSISVKELIGLLGERVFGLSILLFCIPNCLPIPNITGLSAITGIPIIWFGLQMMLGKKAPWIPEFLGKKRFAAKRLTSVLDKAIPYICKIEVFLHPRMKFMARAHTQHALGAAFVILAIVMTLPIPFVNFLPGFAMALMAIGLIERDGAVITVGLFVGAVTGVILFFAGDAIVSALEGLFS